MGNCADGSNNCAAWTKSSPDTFSNCNYNPTDLSIYTDNPPVYEINADTSATNAAIPT